MREFVRLDDNILHYLKNTLDNIRNEQITEYDEISDEKKAYFKHVRIFLSEEINTELWFRNEEKTRI